MSDFTSANRQADDQQQKKVQHVPAHRYLENYILFRAGFKQTELGLQRLALTLAHRILVGAKCITAQPKVLA
jgi:hypothetical protein